MGVRLVLTAGFDRAAHVLALAELATRDGHEIAAVLVVSPFQVERLRALARQRGAGAVLAAARRIAGARPAAGTLPDPMMAFRTAERLTATSLRAWCRDHGVTCRAVDDLNARDALSVVSAARADGVAYGGGGILRKEFLAAASGRVLNAHSGLLPEIRGMNACEWSIALGYAPAVTIHVIDRGIDTGGVIERLPLTLERGDDIERLRAKCAVAGVVGLRRALPRLAGSLPASAPGAADHPQCYTMADAMRQLAERRLTALLERLPRGQTS